jgi:hypothetical protein
MFFVNSLLPVDSHILEESILAIASEKDESMKNTIEGRLVAVIKEITSEFALDRFTEWNIKISDIRTRYNQGKPEDRHASSSWIGKRLKNMSFRNRIIHGYSEIRITSDEYDNILKQYGYTGRVSAKPTNTLPEKAEQDQDVLRVVEGGRVFAQVDENSFNSPGEREFYYEQIQALKGKGERSKEEIEFLANEALEEWRKCDKSLSDRDLLKW